MPADGNFFDIDYTEIELRVLAFMTDNGPERQRALERRERTVNYLTGGSPTGRRPSEPEFQRYP